MRSRATQQARILTRFPFGSILTVDFLKDSETGEHIVGFDDLTTPEPARTSCLWAHVIMAQAPRESPRAVDGYVAYAWLEPVRDERGIHLG